MVRQTRSCPLTSNVKQLLADGRPVALGDRAFDVLLALVERGGQLVTKDELLALVQSPTDVGNV